jgi:glycosyltransferase involved in cell wall biosynthesis
MARIVLVIPTYNCADQIDRVLSKTVNSLELVDQVVVFDNVSQDDTVKRISKWTSRFPQQLSLIQNETNVGLGGTLKRAFNFAILNNFTHVIVLHGDDQADLNDITESISNINDGQSTADLVIGARFHPSSKLIGYSKIRIMGNQVLNLATSLLFGRKILDMIAGLNIYNTDFLKRTPFGDFPEDLTFDSNLLIWALLDKSRIEFVPITWVEDDQISNARVFRQARIILVNLFLSRIRGKNRFTKVRRSSTDT